MVDHNNFKMLKKTLRKYSKRSEGSVERTHLDITSTSPVRGRTEGSITQFDPVTRCQQSQRWWTLLFSSGNGLI